MKTATDELIHRITATGAKIIVKGDTVTLDIPPGADVPDGVLRALKDRKWRVWAHLHPNALGAIPEPWQQALTQAATWGDLETVLDDAQEMYARNAMTGESVEQIAAVCAERAQQLQQQPALKRDSRAA